MSDGTKSELPRLLKGLQDKLVSELGISRAVIGHAPTKGDASERKWIEMLSSHLPARYEVNKAFVIDSNNVCSDQMDIVIHDRQYSPFVLQFDEHTKFVPAESVYAAFEVKQEMTSDELQYAGEKLASIRKLHRTSIPIVHAGGVYPAKPPQPILGGLLTLKSGWSPPFGDPFRKAVGELPDAGHLQLGCAAQDGVFEIEFERELAPKVGIHTSASPLAYFLLRLIARLQAMATVPSLDVMAYARWIDPQSVTTATQPTAAKTPKRRK